MKKKHAEHNEEACDFLFSNGKFNDWVITTAFYSALHFVHHEIFPLTEKSNKYNTFELYFSSIRSKKSTNKHKETIDLVRKHIPVAYSYYRRLFDVCMNARYINYQVSSLKAQKARDDLVNIKKQLKK